MEEKGGEIEFNPLEGATVNAHLDYPQLVFIQINRIMYFRSVNEGQFIAAVLALDKLVQHYQDVPFKEKIEKMDTEFQEAQNKLVPAQQNIEEHQQGLYLLTIDYYDRKFGELMSLVGRRSLTPGMTQSKLEHMPRQ